MVVIMVKVCGYFQMVICLSLLVHSMFDNSTCVEVQLPLQSPAYVQQLDFFNHLIPSD